jgi:hypothetical protein
MQPWQSYVPVARWARKSRKLNGSRSGSLNSANALSWSPPKNTPSTELGIDCVWGTLDRVRLRFHFGAHHPSSKREQRLENCYCVWRTSHTTRHLGRISVTTENERSPSNLWVVKLTLSGTLERKKLYLAVRRQCTASLSKSNISPIGIPQPANNH